MHEKQPMRPSSLNEGSQWQDHGLKVLVWVSVFLISSRVVQGFVVVLQERPYTLELDHNHNVKSRRGLLSVSRSRDTTLAISAAVASSSPSPNGSISPERTSTPTPKPIPGEFWPDRFPAKEQCSKCGLCETTFVSEVMDSCAFLGEGMARMDVLETKVHGRGRARDDMVWSNNRSNMSNNEVQDSTTTKSKSTNKNTADADAQSLAEEARFGVMVQPMQLARGIGMDGAQWTGVTTSIAVAMLESNMVDAVVCIASKEDEDEDGNTNSGGTGISWSEPQPIVAKTVKDVLRGRGVKPCLAPSLKVLDDIQADASIKRLLFCGVGCAVQAFRAVQDKLDLDEVYVLGTNCADNSPTPQAARDFLQLGLKMEDKDLSRIRGYEFMQDFKVHVKMDSDSTTTTEEEQQQQQPYYKMLPYFCLDGTVADAAIAKSCLSCFDYTNGLADVVVGYMAAPLDNGRAGGGGDSSMTTSMQSLTIRNTRGTAMVDAARKANRLEVVRPASGKGKHEQISMATVQSDNIVQALLGPEKGKINEQGMPRLLGEIMARVMTSVGPKEVAFARYSIDYHLLRNYLYILDTWGEERADNLAMPQYAKDIVQHYLHTDASFVQLRDSILDKTKQT
jgi:coenzyme F420-reducing hydrogenase beta subunit